MWPNPIVGNHLRKEDVHCLDSRGRNIGVQACPEGGSTKSSRKGINSYNKKMGRYGATLMQANGGIEKLWWHPINQDSKWWTSNTRHSLAYPSRMKIKIRKGLLQEAPTHTFISSLHTELDRHKTMVKSGMARSCMNSYAIGTLPEIWWPPTKASCFEEISDGRTGFNLHTIAWHRPYIRLCTDQSEMV